MITIDERSCTSCGLCHKVCPRHITEIVTIEGVKKTIVSQEREALCMSCGHCMAVCPSDSITIDTLASDDFTPVTPHDIDADRLVTLLKNRRSVRRYKNKPVPRDVLDDIVKGIHASPTGTGKNSNGVIIIDSRDTIEKVMKHAYKMYEELEKALANPIARFFVKRSAGKVMFATLKKFVMPGMHWYLKWYKQGIGDEMSRDCPALILFYGPSSEPMVADNCNLAAFHGILMAETLGVGTCLNHLIPPACNRVPEIRNIIGLKDGYDVHASVTLGYPSIKFKKTIHHHAVSVHYV